METRKRILVVDDDRITRRLLAVNLERWGYEVVLASDGTEAWEILQSDDSPHIIILDWCLPGMSGVDICRSMRAQPGRPYRYVLLITSRAQKQDLTEAFEAGADDYMAKPIHVRELESRLIAASKAVEKRRRTRNTPEVQHTRRGDELPEDPTVTSVEAATPSDAALRGSIVGGKYKVVRPIASGGMGTVWEGVHTSLGTRVAIKFIRSEFVEEAESVARFETEARTTARLRSRYAVHVYDYGMTAGGMPYLVMEYLEGKSLTEVIEKEGVLPPHEVASVIAQAALALEKAHKLGIIHRDVKPDNIMLSLDEDAPQGEIRQWHAKVVDFGLAKILLEQSVELGPEAGPSSALRRSTSRGALLGTPMFMSPEQLMRSGVADRYADLWGLAMCAYVAMTGQLPFSARTLGELIKQACLHPPPVPSAVSPNVPPGFDEWFARACASKQSDRFQSGSEMARELQGACGVHPSVFYAMFGTPLPATIDSLSPPANTQKYTPINVPNLYHNGESIRPRGDVSHPAPRRNSTRPPGLRVSNESLMRPEPVMDSIPRDNRKASDPGASLRPLGLSASIRPPERPTATVRPVSARPPATESSSVRPLPMRSASMRPGSVRPGSMRPAQDKNPGFAVGVAVGLMLLVALATLALHRG